MTISSTNTRNQKIVLAVVLLFLGWLIASMIPKSETPWDKTSSSYLANHQAGKIHTLSGEDVPVNQDKSPDYEALWTASQNETPDPKTVNLPKDSGFFDADIDDPASQADSDNDETAKSESERKIAGADSQEWSDELKVDAESAPDIKSDPPPSFDESLPVIELSAQAADSLAPPIGSLADDWNTDLETQEPSGAETAAAEPAVSPDSAAAGSLNAAAPAEQNTAVVPLTPLPSSGEHSEIQSESSSSTIVSARPETGNTAAPTSESSPVISLPSKVSGEQNPTDAASQIETAAQQPVLQNSETLTPSNPDSALVPSTSPIPASVKSSGTEPIRQAAASIPEGRGNQVTAAYLEEPAPSLSLSNSSRTLVYTAGSGETWESVAKKFNLTPKESAFYAETNSFRLNSDRSVPENAQLLLPKR